MIFNVCGAKRSSRATPADARFKCSTAARITIWFGRGLVKGQFSQKPFEIRRGFSKNDTAVYASHLRLNAAGYSYLRASIGSNLEAFIAGHIPKTSPIPHDTVIPTTGAQVGT